MRLGTPILGIPSGQQVSGGSAPAASTITQVEVMGGGTLDPLGAGPYNIPSNGSVLRVRFPATKNTAALSDLDPTKFTIVITAPGFDNTGAAATRTLTVSPYAVLRRQSSVNSVADLTLSTQVAYQSGSITVAPSIGTAVDFYLTLPTYIYSADTVVVSVAAGWNGAGSTAGTCPAVTNSSTQTYATIAQPIYGFVNTELQRITASPYNVECCVAFHRYGQNAQWVAAVELWATDGTNSGPHVIQGATSLSAIQTREAIGEVFKCAVDLTGVSDTDGSTTLGVGNAYIDGYIYPWRGVRHQISVDGVGYPDPRPEQVLPFCKDIAGKYGGAVAYVGNAAGATPTVMYGNAANRAAADTAAYGSINLALAALSTYNNNASATGRPASSIAHNNPYGSRVVLLDNAGVNRAYELTANYTSGGVGNCWCDLEAYSGNTAVASYTADNVRRFDFGLLRVKCDLAKGLGYISGNDTAAAGVGTTIFAMEGNNVTFTADISTTIFSRCSYRTYLNINFGNIFVSTNGSAPGLGGPNPTDNSARTKKAIGITAGDSSQPATLTFTSYFAMGCTGRLSPSDPTTAKMSTNDGFLVYNCKFMADASSTVNFWNDTWTTMSRGAGVIQCVFECVNPGGTNVGLAYTNQNSNVTNMGWCYNTGCPNPSDVNDDRGGFSLGYLTLAGSLGKVHDMIPFANLAPRFAFKGDYYGTHTIGSGLGNIGNNPQRYGIDSGSNAMMIVRQCPNIAGDGFAWRACDSHTNDNIGLPTFTNNQAQGVAWTAGSGFGTYILSESVTTNTAANRIPAGQQKLVYDLYGRPRKQTSAAAVGASECLIP